MSLRSKRRAAAPVITLAVLTGLIAPLAATGPAAAASAPPAVEQTQDAPVQDPPTPDTPTDDTPTDDTPVEDAPTDDAPAEDVPAEDAPAPEAPVEDTDPAAASDAIDTDPMMGTSSTYSPSSFQCTASIQSGRYQCRQKTPFKLIVDNRSSQKLTYTPRTEKNEYPHEGKGSGFRIEDHNGVPKLPTDTNVSLAPGQQSASALWLMLAGTQNDGNESRHVWDARVMLDIVQDGNDPSDFQRAIITHDRHHSADFNFGSRKFTFTLRHDPTLTTVGSSALKYRLELENTDKFQRQWRLVIEDAPATSTTTATINATRLTGDSKTWSAANAHLKRPIHRIDVTDVTKTYTGRIPDRVQITPSTVQGLRAGTWENLGQLDPNGTPTINETNGTLTYGQSSFYFQDKDGSTRTITPPTDGSWFTLQEAGHNDVLTAYPDNAVKGQPRTPNGTTITDAQQLRLVPDGTSRNNDGSTAYRIEAKLKTTTGATQCLTLEDTISIWFRTCTTGNPNQQWIMGAANGNPTQPDSWYLATNAHINTLQSATNRNPNYPNGTIYLGNNGSTWRFTTPEPHNQITDIRLTNGIHGTTTPTPIWNLTPPTRPGGFTSITEVKITALEGNDADTASVTSNSLDSVALGVQMKAGGSAITPAHPTYGRIFDHLYFTDDNGRLLTGLRNTGLLASVVPSQYSGTRGVVYLAASNATTSSSITANLAYDAYWGSKGLPVIAQPEYTTLTGRSADLSIACGRVPAYCDTANPGAVYSAPNGTRYVMTRYTAVILPSSAYNWAHQGSLVGWQSNVARKDERTFEVSDPATLPSDIALKDVRFSISLVSRNGTLTSGTFGLY